MMLTFSLYLFLSAQYIVIYANPLYQTYGAPCHCQHNPWYPSDLIFEPSNIDPYTIVHQPSPPAYQTPNNQEYVNKIFSNPSIRAILDPNTKLYDVNGIEIPRIDPQRCPNVINNYIIIPPEVLANEHSKQNGGRKKNSNQRKIKSNHRNTHKNSKIVENYNQKRITVTNRLNNSYGKSDGNKVNQNLIPNENNNKKRNERRRKAKVQNKISNKDLGKVLNNGDVSVKQNDKLIRLKIITHPTNPREEAVVQEFRRRFPGIPEELVRNLLSYLKRKLSNGEIDINNQISHIPSDGKNHKQASKHNSKNRRRKGRKRKDHKKEVAGSSTDKEYESPQEISIHSLKNIEKGIAMVNSTMNITKYTEPVEISSTETAFLFRDDIEKLTIGNETIAETTIGKSILDKDFKLINLDQDLASQNITENSQDVIEDNNNKITKHSEQVLTSEDKKIKQEVNQEENDGQIDNNFKSDTDGHKLDYNYNLDNKHDTDGHILHYNYNVENKPDTDGHKLDYNYNIDNTRLPELGTEDELPITVNGLFEDYYPDFRAENQFSISNEEFLSTDSHQSIKTELSRERRKYEQNYNKNHYTKLPLNEEKVYETDEVNEKLSDAFDGSEPVSMTVQKDSEEITFIAPPGLGTPDFETKNVKELKSFDEEAFKYEPIYKYSDVLDKTSVYSNAKSLKYDKAGPVWKKDKQRDLETVFARSKVVKYGQTPDKDSTVVIAESYPDYEW